MANVDASIVESDKQAVGRRLREFRKTLTLSQEAFGALVGSSKRGIQDNENGKNLPSSELLRALHMQGLDIGWLLTGENSPGWIEAARASRDDVQVEEARWQIAKLALEVVPLSAFVSGDPNADLDAFVDGYNKQLTAVSSVLRETVPTITAQDVRQWGAQAIRWKHRLDRAPASLVTSAKADDQQPRPSARMAAEPPLTNQPAPMHMDEAALARLIAAVREVVSKTGIERTAGASVVAELYAQHDPSTDASLLQGVIRGIWRAQAEHGAPILPPAEEANAISDICNRLSLSSGVHPDGLTGTVG